jgi:hypothetical protein
MPWPGRKLRWHDASVVVKGLAVPVVSRENVVGQDVVAQELRRLALGPQPVPDWAWSGVRGCRRNSTSQRSRMRLPRLSAASSPQAR